MEVLRCNPLEKWERVFLGEKKKEKRTSGRIRKERRKTTPEIGTKESGRREPGPERGPEN